MIYFHGGMMVQSTTNIENTSPTLRQMAELQRDSYEAIAENFASAQRRSIALAGGGLEFIKVQEQNARAVQEFLASTMRLVQLQQRNAEFVRDWTGDAVQTLREQTEHNVRTAETFARGIGKQQESFAELSRAWAGAYRDFLSPLAYFAEGMRTTQRATQQGLEASEQVAWQGLRVAEEATEQTEEVLKQTEKASREAEHRSAVFGALRTTNYEELSVAEVSRKLDELSAEELRKVREFERNHKNRETLIERIDRKIRANKNS